MLRPTDKRLTQPPAPSKPGGCGCKGNKPQVQTVAPKPGEQLPPKKKIVKFM